MKNNITDVYRSTWRFALSCSLLFLIPVAVEFAQHVVEWRAGMYEGIAGAKMAEADPLRLQFGFAKTLALLLPGYWFTRFIIFGGDARRARRLEWPAFGLWLILFALQALQQWWTLFGPALTEAVGLSGQPALWAGYALNLAYFVLSIYLMAWYAAWPAGNMRIGPLASIAIMLGHFWRSVALLIIGALPLMALHYALSFGAIFAPAALDWPLLILDSLVVGLLALTMVGAMTIAARHAARVKGIDLAGTEAGKAA
ncbi:MAG: hypothetical protein U0S50_12320 [Sphingopyxis sp.]|uniref:hypothetical protein n=1 Tax=Sphingopyxis sp. TaxID=1908224 RepID=UPI002ABB05DA|nr:hypothetical protein [Sphingopyxis sp.]MDZ3832581.1 hypothetical protein [Sphingopyxis sp.]